MISNAFPFFLLLLGQFPAPASGRGLVQPAPWNLFFALNGERKMSAKNQKKGTQNNMPSIKYKETRLFKGRIKPYRTYFLKNRKDFENE